MIDSQSYVNYLISKKIYLFTEEPNSVINIPILNRSINWQEVSECYQHNQIAVVDNILNEEVCYRLRDFKLTTNYRDTIYEEGGYEAINYPKTAFSLLEKIIDEFNNKIPFVQDLEFQRAWSFIYNSNCNGVNIHADPAFLNCNLWVTPNESIINKLDHNGLNIWPIEHPPNWNHQQYNGNLQLVSNFINENNVNPIKIEYRFNRCVFFNSKFFHQTQPVCFKNGHENKRINFTFLFNKK